MVAKAWDAISAPLMGVISANTRTRFGQRKPYLVTGGALLLVSMGLLWLPVRFESAILQIVYVTFTYLLYSTVSTVISVRYRRSPQIFQPEIAST